MRISKGYLLLCIIPLILLFQTKVFSQTIITKIDTVSSCPGLVCVPVRVTNFSNVAAISLVIHYNPLVVTWVDTCMRNPAISNAVGFSGSILGGGGTVSISLFTNGTTSATIAGTGILLGLKFTYLGGTTPLTFDTTAGFGYCEYSDPAINVLPGLFKSGQVNSTGFNASITTQPVSVMACVGNNITFAVTAASDTGYQWQVSTDNGTTWTNMVNGGLISGVHTNTLHINSVGVGSNGYKYKCLCYGLCPPYPTTNVVTLTVYPPPTAYAGLDVAICAGDTLQLAGTSATNNTSLNWTAFPNQGNILSATTLTPKYVPSAQNITSGSVRLVLNVTGNSPCPNAKDTMLLTIHPIPPAHAGNDTVICQGGTATLHASGGTSYTWNTVPTQSTPTITVNPAVNTTYRVTVTALGCTAKDSVKVSITPKPTSNAGPDDSICAGQTYSPTGSATNNASVHWVSLGSGTFTGQNTLTPVYTSSAADNAAGSVKLIMEALPNSPCAARARDTLTLTILALPNANAGPDKTICLGQPATLIGSGGGTYVWSTIPPTTGPTITVSPATSTQYMVTVTLLGCSKKDSATVKVDPIPTVHAGNDTIICFGSSAILTATGGVTYQWNTGPTTNWILVSPSTNTTYTVTGTGPNGCFAKDSVTVSVNTSFAVHITPLSPSICQGDSVQLGASANHISSFHWTPKTGLSDTNKAVISASPPLTTFYTVTATDAIGCQTNDTVTVTVFPLPPVQVHPGTSVICENDTVLLTATGALMYFWSPPNGLSSNNLPDVYASPHDSTYYKVVGTDIHGCKASANARVNVNPVPQFSLPASYFLCRGTQYVLNAQADLPNCTYHWNEGSTDPNLVISNPGVYWVTVTYGNCSVIDSSLIAACSEVWVPNAFTPNNDGLNDLFYATTTEDLVKFEMFIYNRWGQQIFHTNSIYEGWDGTFKGKQCPPDVYHWMITYLGQGNVLLEQEGKKWGQLYLFR